MRKSGSEASLSSITVYGNVSVSNVKVYFTSKVALCLLIYIWHTIFYMSGVYSIIYFIFKANLCQNISISLTISPPPIQKSSGSVRAHLHSSNCHSQTDTHGEIVAVCANFSKLRAFSSHHLTPAVAQVSMLKQKKLSLPFSLSYSLAHSDSRCCILMCVCLRGARWGSPLPLLSAHQLGRGKGFSSQTDGTVTPCSHTQARAQSKTQDTHTLTHNGVTVRRKSLAGKTTRFLIERGKRGVREI